MKISLMNVKRQFDEDAIVYESAMLRALRSGKYILGDEVSSFEKEFAAYIGVKYAIGVGNGTDALYIALKSCGIGEGDEVITTPYTFFATAEAIAGVGAVPVFVDIDDETLDIDPKQIETAVSDKTKAILPVHIFGNPCDMTTILDIASSFELKVIEDCAQATGATYVGRQVGSIGDIGCFSFFPTKTLGCAGDGGMITTDDDRIANAVRAIRVHGSGLAGLRTWNFLGRGREYDENKDIDVSMGKYYNFLIGENSRLDALQAAILREKLKRIDEWTDRRNQIVESYISELTSYGYSFQKMYPDSRSSYGLCAVWHKDSQRIKKTLANSDVGIGLFYPIPMYRQPAFLYLNYDAEDFPVSEAVSQDVFEIPIWPEMTDDEVGFVIDVLRQGV